MKQNAPTKGNKIMTYTGKAYQTSDGFMFYQTIAGELVDSMDYDCHDMSWPSLEAFIADCELYDHDYTMLTVEV